MNRKLKRLFLLLMIIIFIVSPFFQFIKSITVMGIYSYMCKKDSFINALDIEIDMPGGLSTPKKDWYPFVMTFNDDKGFSHYIKRNMNYTVLYNFGAFEYLNGASLLYNPHSDYYGAFYGAYFVRELDDTNRQFGFDRNGNIDIEEAVLPGTYDLNKLVLEGFGLYDPVSNYRIDRVEEVDNYLNYNKWTVIDATITTQGPNHDYKKKHQAYIQYGKPPSKYSKEEDFPVTEFKSRFYIRYVKEKKCTVYLYIIGPHVKMIEECDKNFLQKSILTIKGNKVDI